MAKNEAKIKFSADVSGFTEGIKRADAEIRTLRSELKLNNTQLKGNADSTDLLQKRQKLLAEELTKAKEKVDLTNQKYQKASEVMGENSREAQNLKRQLIEAQNQEASIKNEIDDVNKKIAEQEKAESSLRSEVEHLNTEISDYDKCLEFNQKQIDGAKDKTDLLKERQTLLQKEYDVSSQRVDAMTKALEECRNETGENSDEYRQLESDLADAKIKQQELKNSIQDTTEEFKKSASGMNEFAENLNKVGDKIETAGQKMTVVSTGIVGVGVASGKMASDFEEGLANISTLLDDESHLDSYKDAIKDISNDTGKSLTDISDGMYQAISSLGDEGIKTQRIFKVMASSAKAGGAETSDSVDLISAGMKGYNQVSEVTARKISDLAFQTQKLGVTTFPEMAKSMQPLFPLSSSLNISYEELFGSMATLTGVTGNTSEVSTQLKAVFSNLMKPTESMGKLIEKYGYANGAAMIESEGFTGVLQILQNETGGQSDKLAELFSSTEALTAMTALTGTQFDTFKDKLGQMADATGATDAALEKVANTSKDKLKTSLNELKNTGEELGETVMDSLTPIIEDATEKVHGFADWFSGLNDEQKQTIVKVAAVVAAIGPVLIVVGKVTKGISSLIGIIRTVSTVMQLLNLTMLASPVTWIIVGIVAVVAVFVVLWNKCEGFRNFWINLWDNITEKFDGAVTKVKTGIENVKDFFTDLPGAVSAKVDDFKTGIREGFEEAAGKAVNSMKEGYDTINMMTGGKLGEAVNMTKTTLLDMKNAYQENGGGIKGIVAATTTGIKDTWKNGYNVLNDMTGGKLGQMVDMTKESLADMKNAYEENGGGIKGIVAATTTGLKDCWENGYNLINELTGGKLDAMKEKYTEKLDAIKSIISDAVQKFKDLFKFDWSLPKVKMPHFSISGSFSLKPPSVPSIGCEWYANGAVLTKPTVFGWNGDKAMIGGEAGNEAILPITVLKEYIENAMVKFVGAIPQMDYVRIEEIIDRCIQKHPRIRVLTTNKRELMRLIEEE